MTFDELQKNWQDQPSGFRLSIDSELVLKEVQRNQKSFASAIFWRDVREIGISIPLFIWFLYCGLRDNVWEMLLMALGVLFIAVFMTVDRIAQKRKQPKRNDTLAGCLESSLAEVEHQIWLLKNVLWWYFLPPGIGMVAFLLRVTIMTIRDLGGDLFGLSICAGAIGFCVLVFVGGYWINKRAVRKELLPRKVELDELVASLQNGG